jgi:TonB family protein
MRYYIIVLLIFLAVIQLRAQSSIKKSFYPDGKLKSEISYSDSIRDGAAKFYYENGNLKEERNYVNGKVEGTVQLYHKNGKLSEIFSLIDGKRDGTTSLFDSTGTFTNDISYTSGKRDKRSLNMDSSEKLDSSFEGKKPSLRNLNTEKSGPPDLVDIQSSSDPAYFVKLDVESRPVGGMAGIYSRLVYPDEVLKNKIQGTVVVLTFINERGDVDEMTVIKGLDNECNEAAKNAIRYTKFHPGFIKGAPVKSQLKISIDFIGYRN